MNEALDSYDSKTVRRIWHFLVDIADGILASILYGHLGRLTYTTHGLELRIRRRCANGAAGESAPTQTPDEATDDFEARLRRFRD
jgi:hypothetical protein